MVYLFYAAFSKISDPVKDHRVHHRNAFDDMSSAGALVSDGILRCSNQI